jgi:hypothetical protein
MNLKNIPALNMLAGGILIVSIAYGFFYFNYFETPTGDYIGNIREPVLEYMKGNFPGDNYKFLPLYPLLLSLLGKLNPVETGDPVYLTAMILNAALLVPYLLLVFLMYRRFLSEKASLAALLFLGVNVYTVYMAINAELEMVLTLLIILSLHLALRDSPLSYVAAFFTSITKWDSVFIIPAVMFRDFFYRKRWIVAVILGVLATAGVASWLILSFVKTSGQTYVSEIAHRGPNIYRYFIDCFLVTGGFIQWMAAHAWFSESILARSTLLAFLVIPAAGVLAGVVWGAVLIWKKKRKDFAPVFVFLAGFLLIHIVYQNTKDRYVMPILWILTLFLFEGLLEGFRPWVGKKFGRLSDRTQSMVKLILVNIVGIMYIISMAVIIREDTLLHIAFALAFTALIAAVVLYGNGKRNKISNATMILMCGILVNLSVFYGVRALDHHGLSRVEFKKAALWYREHAAAGDKMLISETNVPKYYTGFGDDRFAVSYFIKGKTIRELVPELAAMKVTYVFVDDFYIRRLPIKDPNAIDRRAWVFKEIRDNGVRSGHFRLIETFHTKGGITSYLYRFVP